MYSEIGSPFKKIKTLLPHYRWGFNHLNRKMMFEHDVHTSSSDESSELDSSTLADYNSE
mgnify:CR=1 FL=1